MKMKGRMIRILLALTIGTLFNAMAFADSKSVQLHQLVAVNTPVFEYGKVTTENPVKVNVVDRTGSCRIVVSLLVPQQGRIPNLEMSGRIESGVCNDTSVNEGLVRASFTIDGNLGTLDKYVDVVVLN